MATELGKFLRKIRVDNDEHMKEMSEKLGISIAYLSTVENGNKPMPAEWQSKLTKIYSLNLQQQKELSNAIALSEKSIAINLASLSSTDKKIGVAFARRLGSLTKDEREQLQLLLNI